MKAHVESAASGPALFGLQQNYPNPFNPSTTIDYVLRQSARVQLSVFNLAGQKVATLVDKPQTKGVHSIVFDATHLTSGVYLCQLLADDVCVVKKMTQVRAHIT